MKGNKFVKKKNMKNKLSTKEKLGVNENNKKTNRRRQVWEVNPAVHICFLDSLIFLARPQIPQTQTK